MKIRGFILHISLIIVARLADINSWPADKYIGILINFFSENL